jgi:hypothetical protein
LLRKAASLLAASDDHQWDELLPVIEYFERHDLACWQDLAVATLETMVAVNACETLGRDPWSAVAPLVTRLLHGLANHAPSEAHRAVRAICNLFDHLRAADPLILPDGLPGATAALVLGLPDHRAPLIASFSRMAEGDRLGSLLACGRTTRRELRALRRVAADRSLVETITRALGGVGPEAPVLQRQA